MAITFQHPVTERRNEIADFQNWLYTHTLNHACTNGLSEYGKVINYLGPRRIWYDVTQVLLHNGQNYQDICAQGFAKISNGCFYVFSAKGEIKKLQYAEYSFVKQTDNSFEVNFLHDCKYVHMTIGKGDILIFATMQGHAKFKQTSSVKQKSYENFLDWLRHFAPPDVANIYTPEQYKNLKEYFGHRTVWYDVTQSLLNSSEQVKTRCIEGLQDLGEVDFYCFSSIGIQLQSMYKCRFDSILISQDNKSANVWFRKGSKSKCLNLAPGHRLIFVPVNQAKKNLGKEFVNAYIDSLEGIDDMSDRPFRLFSWDAYNPETGDIYGGEMITARNDQNARDKIVATLLSDEAKAALGEDNLQLVIVQVG